MSEPWVGGYLNGAEILSCLDGIFVPGTVEFPEEQVQQAGIDLRLESVWHNGVMLPFLGSDELIHLLPGCYWVEFLERSIGEEFGLLVNPRSTLFRVGGNLDCGSGKFPSLYQNVVAARLLVENPYGITLQRGVRLMQALVLSETMEFETPHYPAARSEPLTVEKVFRFTGPGTLTSETRGVDVEEVEAYVLGQEGIRVQFAETVSVAPDEVVFSWLDSPHSEERQTMFATRPHVSPWNFLFAMGAVADPGYSGRLNACVHSGWNQTITAGLTLLELQKHKISPVAQNDLYDGNYQSDFQQEETVRWR